MITVVVALITIITVLSANQDTGTLHEILPTDISSICSGTDTAISADFEEVSLVRVVDGDTIIVNREGIEEKIRLLMVNTPESVHSDASKNNEYGIIASNYTKAALADVSSLYLQYDKEREDKYGRTLAYVWLKQDADPNSAADVKAYCFNARLLSDGMAECVIYEPNDLYKDIFQELENNASMNDTGLWQYAEYRSIVGKRK